MHLSIPYNGDLKLLKMLKEANKYPVKTIYGKRLQDVIGGGRARYDIAKYSEDNLKTAIRITHELGAEFNYLFNAPCTANAEFINAKEILNTVDELIKDYEIDMVTVANPFLLKLLKQNFPQIKYSVSIIARVDTLEKVIEYINLGANEITLDYNIYRNFSELKRIRENTSIEYQLIANDGYLFNCPWAMYHFSLEGHDSQIGYNNLLKYFSYCRFNCKQKSAKDKEELIKGMWIRPEDMHYYEDIGFSKFKIIDRLKETEWLMYAINTYYNRKCIGNLSDILCSFDTLKKEMVYTPKLNIEDISIDNLQGLREYWDLRPYINNERLTELSFLEFFVNNKTNCNMVKCSTCGYCKNIANQAVKVNQINADNVVYNLELVKDKMIDLLKFNIKEK